VVKWICLVVSGFQAAKKTAFEGEVSSLFGADFKEMRLVAGDNIPFAEDVYCLVQCSNYTSHVQDLIASPVIRNVLTSYEDPFYLSDHDVEDFCLSLHPERLVVFDFGDIIRVTTGYLSGLTGIVLGCESDSHYRVTFRFHTRSFVEVLKGECLELLDNVFEHLKFPVVSDSLGEEELITLRRLMGDEDFAKYRAARNGFDSVCRQICRKSAR
jgi:hypothetical protein